MHCLSSTFSFTCKFRLLEMSVKDSFEFVQSIFSSITSSMLSSWQCRKNCFRNVREYVKSIPGHFSILTWIYAVKPIFQGGGIHFFLYVSILGALCVLERGVWINNGLIDWLIDVLLQVQVKSVAPPAHPGHWAHLRAAPEENIFSHVCKFASIKALSSYRSCLITFDLSAPKPIEQLDKIVTMR